MLTRIYSPEKPQDLAATPLGKCLVEADPAVKTGALRARRKAMGASVAIEVAVVAALMIWPLFAAGTRLILPRHPMPLPPYGAPGLKPASPADLSNAAFAIDMIHYVLEGRVTRPLPPASRQMTPLRPTWDSNH